MQKINTSVIIATLYRYDDLKVALTSLAQNTLLPDEVIIVDQGDITQTQKLIEEFTSLNISLYFFEEKSLTRARNYGIKKAKGDVIFFFDDDIELDIYYIEKACHFLTENNEVFGFTGRDLIHRHSHNKLRRLFGVIFFISSFSDKSKVLKSGGNTLRNLKDRVQDVEWLSGCNMVIRKNVFDEGLLFNASFMRWSFGEDVMLSYQIYQKYGRGSLKYVPSLEVKHHQSLENRLPADALIKMKIIYRFIFWYECFYKKNRLTLIPYIISNVGLFLQGIFEYRSWRFFKIYISTAWFLGKNKKKIVSQSIDYNQYILEER